MFYLVHFCFPNLMKQINIIIFLSIILITCVMTYFNYFNFIFVLSKEKMNSEEINYSVLIERSLGKFCSNLIQILVFCWYSNNLIILIMTCIKFLGVFNSLYIQMITYVSIFLLFYVINIYENLRIVYFYLIFGIFCQILTLTVNLFY